MVTPDPRKDHYLDFDGGRSASLDLVPRGKRPILLAPAFIDGIAEVEVINYLKARPSQGGVFLDIGAHIGFYAIGLASKFERVIGFEPSPFQFEFFEKNKNINELINLEALNVGVSNVNANEREFFVMGRSGGGNSLHCLPGQNPMYSLKVSTVTIDSLSLSDVRLIKIDVEGHELEVLEGASSTIQKFRPNILCEVWDKPEIRSKFFDVMDFLGYDVSFLFESHPELAWCQPKL